MKISPFLLKAMVKIAIREDDREFLMAAFAYCAENSAEELDPLDIIGIAIYMYLDRY